jgi:ankyrin repeat protein
MRHINISGFSPVTAGTSNDYHNDVPDAIEIFQDIGLEKITAKHYAPLIVIASFFNRVDIIEKLFELNPAEIDRASTAGRTALHVSATENRVECIKYLLKKGAAVNVQDNNGNTPLHYAASKGNIALCFMLIASGADPTIRNTENLIPLQLRQGW